MASSLERMSRHLSVKAFRSFYAGRPEKERWELIDGVAVMMTPPTLAHQRIASNLQRMLLDALDRHDPSLTVYQAVGVNIGPDVDDYDPEPDVAVVDAAIENPEARYLDRFYLVAEIVSRCDSLDRVEARDLQAERRMSLHRHHLAGAARGPSRSAHAPRLGAADIA